MRVVKQEYDEERDAISHDWIKLLQEMNWNIYLLPNSLLNVVGFVELVKPDCVILTGGNDVGSLEQEEADTPSLSQQRDVSERKVLRHCVEHALPVLGICRGMQFVNVFFGGRLVRDLKVTGTEINHAGATHELELMHPVFKKWCGTPRTFTNSFHDQGVTGETLAPGLMPLAQAGPVIEALIHTNLPIVGVQWHPERPGAPDCLDTALFASMLEDFSSIRTQ